MLLVDKLTQELCDVRIFASHFNHVGTIDQIEQSGGKSDTKGKCN